MAEIIPAVLTDKANEASVKLAMLAEWSLWCHLDLADGDFVPEATAWGPESLPARRPQLEIHLMVADPAAWWRRWLPVARRLVIHIETADPAASFLDEVQAAGRELTAAILLSTPLDQLAPWIKRGAAVQLMAIRRLGSQGEQFDEAAIERVAALRRHYPTLVIAVDGGVSLANAADLLAAGASRLVVGSAIWRSADPVGAFKQFQKLAPMG